MSLWNHRLDQNTNENFYNFCPERARAEIIKKMLIFWSKRWFHKDTLKLTAFIKEGGLFYASPKCYVFSLYVHWLYFICFCLDAIYPFIKLKMFQKYSYMGKNVNYQTRILTFHQHLSDEAFLFLYNVMNSFLRNCSCRKV